MTNGRQWALLPGSIGSIVLALAGVGQGQQGLGDPGEGIKLALLKLPAVQKELKVTSKQASEIARLGDEAKAAKKQVDLKTKEQARAKGEPVPKGFPDPAKEARDAAFAELEDETELKLKKILEKDQRVRLSEISLQIEGPHAFLKPELIQALDISEDQVQQIQAILGVVKDQQDQLKAFQKRSADLGSPDLEKQSKEQQKSQLRAFALNVGKKGMVEIGRVLSKKQKDRYTKMIGEPFSLAGLTDEKGRKLFDASGNLLASLLAMNPIRDELKLTSEQKTRLDRNEPASQVLTKLQLDRLRQIELQAAGPSIFLRPELIHSLKINDEQAEEIQGILDGMGEVRRQLRDATKAEDEARKSGENFDPESPVEKTRKEQAKAKLGDEVGKMNRMILSKVTSVLTRAQREALRNQLGEPFDLSKLRPAPKAEPAPPG